MELGIVQNVELGVVQNVELGCKYRKLEYIQSTIKIMIFNSSSW